MTDIQKNTSDIDQQRIKELEQFEKSFFIRWHKDNSVFGYDVIDGRLGFLKNRLNTAIKLLEQYLNGEIDKIEELEQELLPFSTSLKDEEIFSGPWALGVSPCEV